MRKELDIEVTRRMIRQEYGTGLVSLPWRRTLATIRDLPTTIL
jgi:hypothetical protein